MDSSVVGSLVEMEVVVMGAVVVVMGAVVVVAVVMVVVVLDRVVVVVAVGSFVPPVQLLVGSVAGIVVGLLLLLLWGILLS